MWNQESSGTFCGDELYGEDNCRITIVQMIRCSYIGSQFFTVPK